MRWAPGSQRASSTATAENPADHQNATWNPSATDPWCAAMAPSRITARTAVLMRHDMLMTYQPIPEERVLEIVDDLFMPLVAAAR